MNDRTNCADESDCEIMVRGKPGGIYDLYERKVGNDKVNTHYCPGCFHGRVQKLIGEALMDLNLRERAVFVSPVGCSVFSYYYMNCGNVQAAHGRAPAVSTGISRSHPDSVIINYQGDGDLAAIGAAEILHAANRGENMCVIFVNNAIYGMTGGQMAPTTVIGQKTLTTQEGRSVANEGYPLRMAEVMATLEAPIYVERTACTDNKNIMRTRKAIRKGLQLVGEKKGFVFIEILSNCPTNWKVTPQDSIKFIQEQLEPIFKLGVYKDITETAKPIVRPPSVTEPKKLFELLDLKDVEEKSKRTFSEVVDQKIKIAGFGGQGVLTAGVLLSIIGMNEGLNVSWLPSYGPEMRGGTANCSVVLSSKPIGSPLVTKPNVLIAMNGPSLDSFENDVESGGIIMVNSSMIDRKVQRTDVKVFYLPFTELASELGFKGVANMITVGAFSAYSGLFNRETVNAAAAEYLPKKSFIEMNEKAIEIGFSEVKKAFG